MKDITHILVHNLASAVISYRCLLSVSLSPQTNTLLLWTVNINTRLTANSPKSARNVCPRAKITIPPKISQNEPIRYFIMPLFTVSAWRFMSYSSEMYAYPIYVYTCFLWRRVLLLPSFPLIKDGTFLHFTQPVVPLCLAWGFGWRPTSLFPFVPAPSNTVRLLCPCSHKK